MPREKRQSNRKAHRLLGGQLLAELFPSPGVLCNLNRKDHEDRQDHGFEVLEVFAVFDFKR